MLQVSELPETYGRQSQTVSVGAEPNFTYMSASPVPPEITNFRLVAPEGTTMVQVCWLLRAPEMPVTGTPFVSTVLGPVCVVADACAELPELQVPLEAVTT